jgi:3-isopropylmalate/(R)-2-methylmalate dehydratase small subunit
MRRDVEVEFIAPLGPDLHILHTGHTGPGMPEITPHTHDENASPVGHAFEGFRYRTDGSENPDFILNREPYRRAEVLVAGDNFGCGSSREHAPWALLDFGIRCIVSTSFADIFYNNCFKNGILPITVSADELQALMADASDRENPVLTVDLHAQEITRPNGAIVRFEIDEFRRECLLDGLDDIGLTMQKVEMIDAFEKAQRERQPWLYR